MSGAPYEFASNRRGRPMETSASARYVQPAASDAHGAGHGNGDARRPSRTRHGAYSGYGPETVAGRTRHPAGEPMGDDPRRRMQPTERSWEEGPGRQDGSHGRRPQGSPATAEYRFGRGVQKRTGGLYAEIRMHDPLFSRYIGRRRQGHPTSPIPRTGPDTSSTIYQTATRYVAMAAGFPSPAIDTLRMRRCRSTMRVPYGNPSDSGETAFPAVDDIA